MGSLEQVAVLIPQYVEQSAYPAINRDLNMIVDEPVRWSQLASTVRAAAGDIVEDVTYRETFRDAQRDGAGKKRLMFSMMLRAGDRTLTGDEADQACQKIIEACQKEHGATLVQ